MKGDNVVNAGIRTRETAKNSSSPFSSSSFHKEREEEERRWPILAIAIPQMLVNAEVEVELICATRVAADCLGGVTTDSLWSQSGGRESALGRGREETLWDTVYDLSSDEKEIENNRGDDGNDRDRNVSKIG